MALTAQGKPLTMGWCLSCHRNPAPNLRAENEIFNMEWKPLFPDQDRKGPDLVKANHIDFARLIECSICHR